MLSQSKTNLEVCSVNEEFQNNTEVEQNSLIADDGIYRIIKLSKIKYPELIPQQRNEQIKFIEIYFKNCFLNDCNHCIIPKHITRLIYNYLPLTAVIGCYMFSGKDEIKRDIRENKDIYSNIEYLCSFEIKSDLTFELNSIYSNDSCDQYYTIHVNGCVQMNGFVQIKEQYKYQLLFNPKTGNKFVSWQNNNPLLNYHAFVKGKREMYREKVYQQRILELYKTEQELNIKQIKKLHKTYVEKKDLLSNNIQRVNKQKKNSKKNKKEDVPLILPVLKRKIIDDVKNNKLNIRICKKNKKNKNNSNDIHVLYTYLCQHFKIKPLPMSLGDFYAKFSNDGNVVVIQSDGKNIFNKRKKLRRVTRNQLLSEWRKHYTYDGYFKDKIAKWYPGISKQN